LRTVADAYQRGFVKRFRRSSPLVISKQMTGCYRHNGLYRLVFLQNIVHLPQAKHHLLGNVFGFLAVGTTASANLNGLHSP
jgi:hypothetical protein